jgi:L-ascorbate metabolism protein UlaG (beta-lactamase superfamily)
MSLILRLLGHASFKLKVDDKVIYIDPYAGDDSEYAEKANLILITHKHRDHSDPTKIALMQDESTTILTSSDNAENLTGNVVAIDPGEKQEVEGITVYGVPGYNVMRKRDSGEPFHPREIQTAFVIEAKGKRIYFAGDTEFIEEMKDLKDIDYALLPIDGKYTMDPTEALDAVGAIKPKNVIPMHWRDQSPEDFKRNVEKTHTGVAVLVPKPGTDMEL